jgi:hypothetical protein
MCDNTFPYQNEQQGYQRIDSKNQAKESKREGVEDGRGYKLEGRIKGLRYAQKRPDSSSHMQEAGGAKK